MPRRYIPVVGEQVKLKAMWHYNEAGVSLWARLKVVRYIPGDDKIFLRVLNGMEETEQTVMVKLRAIQPPTGWKPVYTITCKDIDQAQLVRDSWFARGINVWASHDLSSAGQMAFTPVKPEGATTSPHWQYTGNPVEVITPADCPQLFRIEVLHQWEPELPPTTEKTARRKAIIALREKPGVELHFVPDGYGGRMPLCERIEAFYDPAQ